MLGMISSSLKIGKEVGRTRVPLQTSVLGRVLKKLAFPHYGLEHSQGDQRQPHARRPKLIGTLVKFRNKNKYCKYHEDHGHYH